jgi:hypothetical protein
MTCQPQTRTQNYTVQVPETYTEEVPYQVCTRVAKTVQVPVMTNDCCGNAGGMMMDSGAGMMVSGAGMYVGSGCGCDDGCSGGRRLGGCRLSSGCRLGSRRNSCGCN